MAAQQKSRRVRGLWLLVLLVVIAGPLLVATVAAPGTIPRAPQSASVSAEPRSFDLAANAMVVRREVERRAVERRAVERLDDISGETRFAVSVRDEESGAAYDHGSGRFRTASLVKVHLVALMSWRARQDGAELTDAQRRDAEEMLVRSENDPALRTYDALGGRPGIERGLQTAFGTSGIRVGDDSYWGRSTTTPRDVVTLLERVLATDLSAATTYAVLRDAMSRVVPEQRWGISVLADPGSRVQTKVGWFRTSKGWIVNSSGRVIVDGSPVLISVMTDRNRSFEAGIAAVEEVAGLVGQIVRQRRPDVATLPGIDG